jgi:hypothetical protein
MLQDARVTFREGDDPDAWRIDVVVDRALFGRIYRSGGTYLYFEGPHNDIIWSLADLDLQRLESRVRAALTAEPASVSGEGPSGQPAPVQAG